jgi:hypothetical protein
VEGNVMLTALVLICSMATTPDLATCSSDNAQSVMRVPQDFSNPATCLMLGQAYVAQTELGQELGADERVKIVCAPAQRAASLVRGRTRAE